MRNYSFMSDLLKDLRQLFVMFGERYRSLSFQYDIPCHEADLTLHDKGVVDKIVTEFVVEFLKFHVFCGYGYYNPLHQYSKEELNIRQQ